MPRTLSLPRSIAVPATRALRRSRLVQVGLMAGFWLAGEALVRLSGLPLPGGIVGLALALGLFFTHRLDTRAMRRGAQWLLAEMLLFFVPAVLVVLDHRELFGVTGLKILFVILASTLAVMVVTALTVERCYRWSVAHARLDDTARRAG